MVEDAQQRVGELGVGRDTALDLLDEQWWRPGAPMLAIELLFPADRATAELLKNLPTNPDDLLAPARKLRGAQ